MAATAAKAREGNDQENAFLRAMVPHHESAVEMAKLAQRRGRHRQIKQLGDRIVATQSKEIGQMERLHKRLFGSEITPDPMAHKQLGLSADAAGMAHMGAPSMLERATPFDRAFIDEMVTHHQGAIRMANAILAKSHEPEIRSLAGSIATTQSHEIDQLNDWRKEWYGRASPAGGIPKGGSSEMEEMPGMEH